MEIDKGYIKDHLHDMQNQADGIAFAGTNENDLWPPEFIADYIVEKITNVSESLICYITGCVNIRDNDECLCDEHLID